MNPAGGAQAPIVQSFFKTYFIDTYFGQYADFKSLCSRKTFWLSYLAYFIVTLGVAGLAMVAGSMAGFSGMIITSAIISLFGLAMTIPSLAIIVRRLRDINKSPWMILVSLIPVIGSIWLLVLLCKESEYEHDDPETKFLVADYAVGAGSIVLFIVGIVLYAGAAVGGFGSQTDEAFSDPDSVVEEDIEFVEETEAETVSEAPATSGDWPECMSGSYTGTIGKYHITMEIEVSDRGEVNGRYQYSTSGNSWLTLQGSLLDEELYMVEYNDNGDRTGEFECSAFTDGEEGFGGSFEAYDGRTYDVTLRKR